MGYAEGMGQRAGNRTSLHRKTIITSTMSLLRQLNSIACTQKKKQKSPILIQLVPTKTRSELSVGFFCSIKEYEGKT